MPANPAMPVADSPVPGARNARGEWRPAYPIRYAPVFTWPVRIGAMLKWFVSYPGFMWPRNLLLLGVSAASWFLTQPAIARCEHFEFGWIAQIYVRNLGLMWLFYGGYHLYLYTLRREGTNHKYDANWPAKKKEALLDTLTDTEDRCFAGLAQSERRQLTSLLDKAFSSIAEVEGDDDAE